VKVLGRSAIVILGAASLASLVLACGGGSKHPGYVDSIDAASLDAGGDGALVASNMPNAQGDAAAADGCGSVDLAGVQRGNVLVVFDQSNSMNSAYATGDAGASRPKYAEARDAISAAIAPLADQLALGAIFFPTVATGDVCSLVDPIGAATQLPITPAPTFAKAWASHFAAPFKTIYGTPLAVALQRADDAYVDPSPLAGKRVVVVLTDGEPTCVTDAPHILAPVKAMRARGIATYVVGLPGSTGAATLLDAIASAGGTGAYLSPADPAALGAQLAGIASASIDRCTFTFAPAPPDPKQVHLLVTDASHPTPYEIAEGSGWTLSADGATATLDGALCDQAKGGAYASMRFVFGCVALF
jgi:hypothetical protein